MEALQAILIGLVGALVGIFIYQRQRPQKAEIVEVVREEPPVAPYWTMYSPGYEYWPRFMDSYWLNYMPYYGPIAGGYGGYGGRHNYLPNHWGGKGYGHSGVAVGGGGGGGHGGGGGGHH